MKEQLKALEELQRRDARLKEIEASLKELPEKLDQMRRNLGKVERMLEMEREKLAEVEKYHREQELQLKTEEAAVLKAKGKLQGIRTSKEYMAIQRELETTRKMAAEREEEILKLLDAIEQSKKTIESHASDLATLRETVQQEEAAINARMAELEEQAGELRREREDAAGTIRPDILKRYDTIRMRRGLAVVPVHEGVCEGCNMAIPPQLYNILQRRDSVEICPTCYRIIYWDQIMLDEDDESTDTPPPPADSSIAQ